MSNNESQGSLLQEENVKDLDKMSEYKTYAKGLMDIALLSANANQLRHALELCAPFKILLIVLLTISILLQITASAILCIENIKRRRKDYSKCHKYNATIGVLVIVIIAVNIVAVAFDAPGELCVKPVTANGGGI